jgi:hypothetical protein
VPEKQILPKVEPMVLAVDHPKIPTVFPHGSSLRRVTTRAGLSVARMIANQVEELPELHFCKAEKAHPSKPRPERTGGKTVVSFQL